MMPKINEKEKAIKLRKRGSSYSEILKKVSVAKSTLSLWLRDVGLAKKQKQRLTDKKIAAALRGAKRRKGQRIDITKKIKIKAIKDIKRISKKELWLIGIILYWTEGSKQKENNPSQVVKLSNSDPRIIKIFLKWLKENCLIPRKDIKFRIALHETRASKLNEIKRYWSSKTGFPISRFKGIDWKKNKIRTIRNNIGDKYFGLLDVYVKRSTNLNRKISGWIDGIYKNI